MRLTHVTVTGIDDSVSLQWVDEMCARFGDSIEFGVLLSRSRKGTPRYPSPNWLCAFVERFHGSDRVGQFSAHLCGSMSDKTTDYWRSSGTFQSSDYFGGPPLSSVFDRMQLNGFPESKQSASEINSLAGSLRDTTDIILPIPNRQTLDRAKHQFLPNVHFLHDRSRGRGIAPTKWPEAELDGYVGFAGGIDDKNISGVIEALAGRPDEREFWLDLESGARDPVSDQLDRDRVERICNIVEDVRKCFQ